MEGGGGTAVTGAETIEAEVGIAVIGGDHQEGIGVAALEGEGDGQGIVEGELITQGAGGVVIVAGVIDATAFDQQEEAVLAFEVLEGAGGHFGESGDGALQFGAGIAIDGIGQVAGSEQTEPAGVEGGALEILPGSEHLVAGGAGFGEEIALVFAFGGVEMGQGTAEEDIELSVEQLAGDFLALAAVGDIDGEAGGGGVGDFGGGDEGAAPAGLLEQGSEWGEVDTGGGDVEFPVLDMGTAAPAGSGGGGIGDQGVEGTGIHEALDDGGILLQIDPGGGPSGLELAEVFSAGQGAQAHAIGDDMDDAGGLAVAEAGGARVMGSGSSGGTTNEGGTGGEGAGLEETTSVLHGETRRIVGVPWRKGPRNKSAKAK